MLRRITAYALFTAVATALVVAFVAGLRRPRTPRAAPAPCAGVRPQPRGDPAPPFALPDLDGRRRTLAQLRGKVVLLHFWATWCPPCIEELPSLYRLQERLTDPRFALLTVSVDSKAADVRRYFERNGLPALPVLLDPEAAVPKAYGTRKYPESYLIDAQGTIRYRFVNKRDWASPAAIGCIRSLL